MTAKTIKISDGNYIWLLQLAAELQKNKKMLVSFDNVISTLKEGEMKSEKISDLAGSWDITEKEAKKIKKDFRKGWNKWKIPSA